MKIQYFGDPSNPKIVVLHPMLLDGKSMLPLLGELRNSHCVIAPDLTGHGTDTVSYTHLTLPTICSV